MKNNIIDEMTGLLKLQLEGDQEAVKRFRDLAQPFSSEVGPRFHHPDLTEEQSGAAILPYQYFAHHGYTVEKE